MSKTRTPQRPDAEEDLFAEAMADVRPLERNCEAPAITLRKPVPISEREREVLAELDGIVTGERPLDLLDSDGRLEGFVRGLDPRVLKQLRKGELSIQADLDLHGLDAPTARSHVESFISDCHEEGLRCVRIVHGRGRNSPGGIPVLRESLPRWLARGPARRIVLAYTSAPPKDGGSGALCLLLRRQGGRRRGQ